MSLLSRLNRKSRLTKKNIMPRTLRCESLEDRRVLATMVGTEAEFVTALANGDACIQLTADITLSGAALEVTQTVEILGDGFTVDAAGMSRVFTVDDGDGYVNTLDASIDNMTITGGAGTSYGGGIFNAENLTITNSTITGNAAIDPANTYTGVGGGISTPGNLTMSDSSVTGNTASSNVDLPSMTGYYITGVGGGIDTGAYTYLNLSNVNVDGNYSANVGGGLSIDSPGPHYIDGSTFNNNKIGNASVSTGHSGGGSTLGTNVFGGGLYVDAGGPGLNLNISNSEFSGNVGGGTAAAGDDTFDYGMGLDLTTRGVYDVVNLDNITVSNNLSTTESESAGETSVQRGTGLNMTAVEGGTFNVSNSTISGNTISDMGDFPNYGAGLSVATFDTGAGLAYSGVFNINDSDITGNLGFRGAAIGVRYQGGYNNDGVGARSILNISGGEISGNYSGTQDGGNAGGVTWAWLATDITFDGVTVDGNSSSDDGGAFANLKAFAAMDFTRTPISRCGTAQYPTMCPRPLVVRFPLAPVD